jgi:hypothetical protein
MPGTALAPSCSPVDQRFDFAQDRSASRSAITLSEDPETGADPHSSRFQ